MKQFAEKFYKSTAWKKCRAAYIAKRIQLDGGLCEICHEELGYILHHKIELCESNINDVDITLNHCNLQYVCHHCHDDIHLHGGKREAIVKDGRVVPFFNDDGDRFKA